MLGIFTHSLRMHILGLAATFWGRSCLSIKRRKNKKRKKKRKRKERRKDRKI